MSRAHDRRPSEGTPKPGRAPRPAQGVPDGVGPQLDELREALGNAAMSRMLDPRTSAAIEAKLGGGEPLPGAPAATPDVRLHDDADAAALSRRLGAVAFTFGRDIFLADEAPDLGTPAGARLLGHELTHVRQQQVSGTTRPRRVSAPGSPAEREAAHAGGGAAAAPPAGAQTVHRQAAEGEQEEEVMTMTSETVHRQMFGLDDDELEADIGEAGDTDGWGSGEELDETEWSERASGRDVGQSVRTHGKGTVSEPEGWGSGEELDETEWSEAGSDPADAGQEWSAGSAPAEGDVLPGLEMETTGKAAGGEVLAGPAWPSLQEIESGTGPSEPGLAMEETGSTTGPAGTAKPDLEDAEVAIYEDEIQTHIQEAVDNLSGPDPDPIEAVRKLQGAAIWLEGLGQVYLYRDPEKYNAIMALRAGALSLRDAVSPAALTMRTAGDLGSLAGGLLDEAAALGSRLR